MRSAGMRISTHPGQYIVLSSIREDVVAAAIAELAYHDRLLSAFGLGDSHKVVLHLGSGVADPRAAYDRFAAGYRRLLPGAAGRLVLENDERWPLDTTLVWAERLELPVVFDAFHHELAPSMERLTVRELVLRAAETWNLATAARRCTSRIRHRKSDRVHTRRRSTAMPSPGSPRRSVTCRSTASSR